MLRVFACLGLLLVSGAAAAAAQRLVDLRDLETPKVVEIRIDHLGAKPITNRELRAAMHTQVGERFARRFFRADLSMIENLYRSRGYMDVDIVRRRFALDDEGRLHITLKMDAGRQWTVSAVDLEFTGQDSLLAAILRSRLQLGPDEVFRYGEVIADERQLLVWLNSEGFAHAQVSNDVQLDSRRQQAAVSFQVTTGRRMYFGDVSIDDADLQTRRSLLDRQLTFREGELYDPEKLRRTRNNLSRTGLFRSVTLTTPLGASGDSVQPVVLRLRERKFIQLRSRLFVNNNEPGVSGRVQHANFLGRGNRIGVDANLGQPLQGLTFFLTERDLLASTADLTLSAGVTDEWGDTRVFADPQDAGQFDLLINNYSRAKELQLQLGAEETAAQLSRATYDYPSVERLWKLNAALSRRWERSGGLAYASNLTMNWTQSRNRPIAGRVIDFKDGGAATLDDLDSGGNLAYDDNKIPIDDTWVELLANEARALNFELDFQRDTRDNQIAPTHGTFVRTAALYAIELGGSRNRVFDGDVEARNYLRVGERIIWAQAVRGVMTGTLRRESDLPQAYWKKFGGEGSVRGVERDAILAAGGGRGGVVLRSELRFTAGPAGFVLFWDRAGVWRWVSQASWGDMTSGYGGGLRWDFGIPLRLDLGWSGDMKRPEVYVSIGQAF